MSRQLGKETSKNILIIGASGGIGLATAKKMAREGHRLLLHCNTSRHVLENLREELNEDQVLQIIQADLSEKAGIDKLLSELVFSVGTIVFASGKAVFGLFQDMSEQIMDEMLTLHVKAPWMLTKKLLPSMIKKRSGRITFITSIWGEYGAGYEVLYSAVKGAENSFVKALAKETASSGIFVYAVSPGFIDTKMNADLLDDERSEIIDSIALKRPGLPFEVANTVHFLHDLETSHLSGQVIPVNGGWFI